MTKLTSGPAKKEPEAAGTETFVPAVDFLGFPDGETGVQFKAGVESIPVTADFAALMRAKGLVAGEPTAET